MPDVLIIGAGIIGCAVAHELTRRGARVEVLDPRGIGLGASQASAGMLAPFTEGRRDPIMQALGAASLARYDALVGRLREAGFTIPYARMGSMDVALDGPGADALAFTTAALIADGVDHELLSGQAAREAEPAISPEAVAALHIPAHGFVGVQDLVEAMWQSAERGGARLLLQSARRVSVGHGTVRVETTTSPIDAPHVVLASGCWAGAIDLAGAPPLPVRPVRGQLLALNRRDLAVKRTVWGPGCYAVPWENGTLLVGATVEDAGFDEQATLAGVTELTAAVTQLMPGTARAGFVGVRVGLRPATPDERPILGPSSRIEGLVYATGHYRNGALLAPITAESVADLIDGRATDQTLAPFAPARFGEY